MEYHLIFLVLQKLMHFNTAFHEISQNLFSFDLIYVIHNIRNVKNNKFYKVWSIKHRDPFLRRKLLLHLYSCLLVNGSIILHF